MALLGITTTTYLTTSITIKCITLAFHCKWFRCEQDVYCEHPMRGTSPNIQ